MDNFYPLYQLSLPSILDFSIQLYQVRLFLMVRMDKDSLYFLLPTSFPCFAGDRHLLRRSTIMFLFPGSSPQLDCHLIVSWALDFSIFCFLIKTKQLSHPLPRFALSSSKSNKNSVNSSISFLLLVARIEYLGIKQQFYFEEKI